MRTIALGTLVALAACAAFADDPPPQQPLPPGIARKVMERCDSCVMVKEVRKEKRKGEGGAVGIVAGAAAGGLLGSQVGKGSGKTLATVGGAVAGGFAGNEIQKQVTKKEVWVTRVRMRDGTERSFEQEQQPRWSEGTIVRIKGNRLASL